MTYCHQFHNNVKSQVSIFQSMEIHVPGLGSSRVLGPLGSWVLKDPASSRVLGPLGSSRVLVPCFMVCR